MTGIGFPRERLLQVAGARLHLREIGHGPAIVVLHGGPDFDHEYLLPELDTLAASFRLVYYDQRGRGRSSQVDAAPGVSLASELDDLDRVIESTGSDAGAVTLLGHSFGTLLALEYATRHPDRIGRLVLVAPAPISHAGAVALRSSLAAIRTPDEAVRMRELLMDPAFVRGELAADAEYYRMHFRPTVAGQDRLDMLVGRLRRAFTPEGIVAARVIEERLYAETWSREDYDLEPALRTLAAPAIVVRGRRDFIPLEHAQGIATAIPGARLLELDDCGHFVAMDEPETFAGIVREFLA